MRKNLDFPDHDFSTENVAHNLELSTLPKLDSMCEETTDAGPYLLRSARTSPSIKEGHFSRPRFDYLSCSVKVDFTRKHVYLYAYSKTNWAI